MCEESIGGGGGGGEVKDGDGEEGENGEYDGIEFSMSIIIC